MTDYTDLINELTWFAAQDKDFIALHESINTKSVQAIKALKAERDAAFTMSRCECETNEACANLVKLHDEVERLKQERDAALVLQCDFTRIIHADNRKDFKCSCEGMMREITTLKSALREVEKALVMNIVGTSGRTPATHEAITTIRTALGETE